MAEALYFCRNYLSFVSFSTAKINGQKPNNGGGFINGRRYVFYFRLLFPVGAAVFASAFAGPYFSIPFAIAFIFGPAPFLILLFWAIILCSFLLLRPAIIFPAAVSFIFVIGQK